MKRAHFTALAAAFCLSALLLFRIPVYGQETIFSNIRGIVADQSGASVPGAKVELLNQGTRVTRNVVSDADGSYRFDNIVSGVYTVTVEATGFRKYVHSDINLTASKTILVDVALELGNVTQEVTVSGTTAVETEVPTISVSLTKELMKDAPISGGAGSYRILQTFFMVVPGGNSGAYTGGAALNGMPNTGFSERSTIDGIRVLGTCCQTTPTPQTLSEMKLITHNAGAEYATPTTMQLTTRQGTSEYHGEVFWVFQDKSLDARDSFLANKPILHNNNLGGGVGGPIPKIKKAFFFFSFDGVRLNNTATTDRPLIANNLPTTPMQKGDFSQLLDAGFVNAYNKGVFVTVKDPLTGQPFPNNIIPDSRVSSVSKAFISQFWAAPSAPGLSGNQFLDAKRPNRRDKWDLRGDYNISEKQSIMARYGWAIYDADIPTTNLTPETTANGKLLFISHNGAVANTYVISPYITNEVKYGFSIMPKNGNFFDYQLQDIAGKTGLQGTGGLVGLPGLAFSGFTGFSASARGYSSFNTQTFADALSIAHGKHFLKFGVQYNYESYEFHNESATPPSFTFNGRLSGFDWADFMLGLPASVTRNLAASPYRYTQGDWGFYAQDEMRLKRNLNLTLGVRYQIWPASYERSDLLSVFDPVRKAVIVPSEAAKKLVVPTFPTQKIPVLTAAEANYPARNRSLVNTDFGALAPRLGVAWRPFGRTDTVLRAGLGLFFWNGRTSGPAAAGSLFTGSQTLTQQLGSDGKLVPIMQFPNPLEAFGAGAAPLDPTTMSFTAADPNIKLPYVTNWNVTAEHEFRFNAALRVSYMGSAERRNQFGFNINEAPPGRLAFAQSRRPIPEVRDINYVHNGGYPNSNMLQAVLDRRPSRGVFYNVAFTWMHKITDIQAIGPGAAFGLDRFRANPSFGTPRKQLILLYGWELPFGSGRRFLSRLPAAAEAILGGWKISGMTKFESGQYLSPTYVGVNPAGTTPGTGTQLPDRIGDGNFSRSVRSANAPNKPFFDTAAFVCPGGSAINGQPNLLSAGCPLSTPANVGRFGNSAIYLIEGPGANAWALSLDKAFRLKSEARRLEIGAQFANPFNHPNWAAPATNLSSPATLGLITNTKNLIVEPWSLSRRRIALQMKLSF